jgi:hypothetical protein
VVGGGVIFTIVYFLAMLVGLLHRFVGKLATNDKVRVIAPAIGSLFGLVENAVWLWPQMPAFGARGIIGGLLITASWLVLGISVCVITAADE